MFINIEIIKKLETLLASNKAAVGLRATFCPWEFCATCVHYYSKNKKKSKKFKNFKLEKHHQNTGV